MEEEIEKPKRSNAKNIEKGREFVNSILNNEEEIKKIEEQQKKEIAELEGNVYPVGGYGSTLKSVKYFESNFRYRQQEHGLMTSLTDKPNYILLGLHDSVPVYSPQYIKFTRDFYNNYTDRIFSHIHPPYATTENEDLVKFGGPIDSSFSSDDIIFSMENLLLEMRVVSRNYTAVLQPPVGGWKQFFENNPTITIAIKNIGDIPLIDDATKQEIKVIYDNERKSFSDIFKLNLVTNDDNMVQKNAIHRDSTHAACLAIAKKYGFRYSRYVNIYKTSEIKKRIEVKDLKKYKFFQNGNSIPIDLIPKWEYIKNRS